MQLVVKRAAEATIADITAADIVVFGAQKTAPAEVPAEFSEFLRIFKGITLAGRTAGFFSMGTEKATSRLRKALKDTEINAVRGGPPVHGPEAGNVAVCPGVVTEARRCAPGDAECPRMRSSRKQSARSRTSPSPGVLFYDITGILVNPKAFSYCIDRMDEEYGAAEVDAVAAIESRGFIFAAPFAVRRGLPLILLRKKGKLPGETYGIKFTLEYGQDVLEVHRSDVRPRGRGSFWWTT